MKTKEALYRKCEAFLDSRLQIIQNTIHSIQKSLQTETKSSAGDKHETGRAMLQLEREKVGQQLAELQKQQEVLKKIDAKSTAIKGALGSVVKTSNANYFISISIGEVTVNHEMFYCISGLTPIGKLLLSKVVGDKIEFRNKEFVIEEVF